jgi:hypothetical protein
LRQKDKKSQKKQKKKRQVIKRKSEYLRSVKSISEFLTRKTLKQIFLIEFVSKKGTKKEKRADVVHTKAKHTSKSEERF